MDTPAKRGRGPARFGGRVRVGRQSLRLVVGGNPTVRRILEVVGAGTMLPISNTLDEALAREHGT